MKTFSLVGSVAPRMGSVGWNASCIVEMSASAGRSPHGERGLESVKIREAAQAAKVAPRMGSVGWNSLRVVKERLHAVAPRMGSVGWKSSVVSGVWSTVVAPRMGSVGWNRFKLFNARVETCVAPRMGSVGWNVHRLGRTKDYGRSLPAWGAWVGIPSQVMLRLGNDVAPRMGSVGWN